jgi:hypothetical protein
MRQPRAPIVDTSKALGKRGITCEIATADYESLAGEAKRRELPVSALVRHIVTALAQRPELIATVLGENAP